MNSIRTENRGVKTTPLFVALILAGSMFFFNLSLAGLGATVVSFLFLSLFSSLALYWRLFRIHRNKRVEAIFILHALFMILLSYAFSKSNSLASQDVKYLISSATSVFWWPILYTLTMYRQTTILRSFRIGYMICAYIVIVCWIALFLYTGDLFFLRTEKLEIAVIEATLLRNPNLFSRVALIIMIVLYFFHLRERLSGSNKNTALLATICILAVIVITSLSRANMLSLAVFFVGTMSIDRLGRIRIMRISAALLLALFVASVSILVVPEVRERFEEGAEKVSYVYTYTRGAVNSAINVPSARARTWVATLLIIRDNALYGVGFSRANQYLEMYGSIKRGGASQGKIIDIHGGFLKIAAYGGLISIGSFIVFYFGMCWYSLKRTIDRRDIHNKSAAYATLLMLIVLLPANIGADCFGLSLTWMSIAFLMVNAHSPGRASFDVFAKSKVAGRLATLDRVRPAQGALQ